MVSWTFGQISNVKQNQMKVWNISALHLILCQSFMISNGVWDLYSWWLSIESFPSVCRLYLSKGALLFKKMRTQRDKILNLMCFHAYQYINSNFIFTVLFGLYFDLRLLYYCIEFWFKFFAFFASSLALYFLYWCKNVIYLHLQMKAFPNVFFLFLMSPELCVCAHVYFSTLYMWLCIEGYAIICA